MVTSLFQAFKDIGRLFSQDADQQLGQVFEVDMNDMRLVGFVMEQDPRLSGSFDDDDEERVAVYLAMSYQLGGFTVHVPRSRVTPHGDLAIDDVPDDMPGVAFRAALCRCGQSKNKPFCDNSHRDSGFHDAGAVGEKGPGSDASGGRLVVQPVKDGPLVVTGNLTLVAGSGREAWHGEKVALCRCGQSKNKPFCDGTHSKAGFKSD